MELTERITSRVTELTSETEQLRKQLDYAEHELETAAHRWAGHHQLTADDQAAAGEVACPAPAGQHGFGLLVPLRS